MILQTHKSYNKINQQTKKKNQIKSFRQEQTNN